MSELNELINNNENVVKDDENMKNEDAILNFEQKEEFENEKKDVSYQSYDIESELDLNKNKEEFDDNNTLQQDVCSNNINKIIISAKDIFAYMIKDNEKNKWNLANIINRNKKINEKMAEKAREMDFSKTEIKRNVNPVVAYVLENENNDEILKSYFLSISTKTPLPFKLKHSLEQSNLDKKVFKTVNKFAKKDAKIPGVEVVGAQYNIIEKLKMRFNLKKSLPEGKRMKVDSFDTIIEKEQTQEINNKLLEDTINETNINSHNDFKESLKEINNEKIDKVINESLINKETDNIEKEER